MNLGISLYFSEGFEANKALVERAKQAGVRFAFTSLQIPEEKCQDYRGEVLKLLALCREAGISLVSDVSPATLGKLGCSSINDLAKLGVDYLRLDFGFSEAQTAELSHRFHVVFNASTVSKAQLRAMRDAGANFERCAACHNFYPKRFTGLSLAKVERTNARLGAAGFTTMAFVPGDSNLRGPLREGLPTVEEHRGDSGDELVRDMLDLFDAQTDVVLLGDPGASDGVWERMGQLSANRLRLRAKLAPEYAYLFGRAQHDRPDSSDYLVRSQESRLWKDAPVYDAPREMAANGDDVLHGFCSPGTILVSNRDYGRYAGEVQIALRELPLDPRDTVAGHIVAEDVPFLRYLHDSRGFELVSED